MKHLLTLTLLLLSTLAFGQVPNTFSSGETISSSKINANFAYLADAVKNSEVSGMMICLNAGVLQELISTWQQTNFVYYDCFTDNETGFDSAVVNQKYPLSLSGNISNNSSTKYITFNNLHKQRWVLYKDYINNDANKMLFIFYKVSSD